MNQPDSSSGTQRPAFAVETHHLTRKFGDYTAVDDIHLKVPHGSFFAFLGPNGAGKTTTLRMLTGLLQPSEGDASVVGLSIRNDLVEIKKHIGVVPDDLALFNRLSIWEHLTMCGRIHSLSQSETHTRGEDLLNLLQLWDDRGKYVVDCSHGMQKKLALAIALIHNPRVLFLDEPFEGIDPIAGRSIRDLLVTMAKRGITIFLTSHILEIVERLADRVAIIAEGRIVAEESLVKLRQAGTTLESLFIEAVGSSDEEAPELSWLG